MRLADLILDWAADHRLPSLTCISETATLAHYRFDGITPAIQLVVREDGISIAVFGPDQTCWDLLLDLDVAMEPCETGVRCRICADEGKDKVFPNEVALLEDHILQPIQRWWANKLESATHLKLGRAGGCSWVELVKIVEQLPGNDCLLIAISNDAPG